MLLCILAFVCIHYQWAAAEDRVYNFSFSKAAAAVKPKVKKAKRVSAPVAAAPVSPAPVASPPPAPPVAASAVEPVAHITAVTPAETAPPQNPIWEVSAGGGAIVDRNAKASGAIVGGKYALWRDLYADAQAFASKRVDGSLGLAWKFKVDKYLPRFSPRLVGGILSTPGASLRPYYGVEAAYTITDRILALGGMRLQDDSRYGVVGLGLGFTL